MDIIYYYILSSEVSSPFSIRFAYLLQTGNCLLKCVTMAFIDFIFENCCSLACWGGCNVWSLPLFPFSFFKAALVHVAMVPHPNGYLWLYSGYCTWKVDCNDELRLRASSAAPTEVPVVCICMYPQAAVPDLRWKLGLSGGCSTAALWAFHAHSWGHVKAEEENGALCSEGQTLFPFALTATQPNSPLVFGTSSILISAAEALVAKFAPGFAVFSWLLQKFLPFC